MKIAGCLSIQQYQHNEGTANMIINIMSAVIFFSFIVTFSSLIDGLNISWKFKTIFLLSITIYTTMYAAYCTYCDLFVDKTDNDYLNWIVKIDLLSWMASSSRVIILFMWKQTIKTIYYKNERASLLSVAV